MLPIERAKAQLADVEERKKVIEAAKDEPFETFELEGVVMRYIPFSTTRSTDHVIVECDGVQFGMEVTYSPWNIFKEMRVWHDADINVDSIERGEEILRLAGVKGVVDENPYADPPRYGLVLGADVLDVAKVWNVVKPTPK